MAERGKDEESQHTEAADPGAELSRHRLLIREAFERLAGADPSDFASEMVMIEARKYWEQARARRPLIADDLENALEAAGSPVERDDAYYDQVRQAVGRGAPSVLLGTSTKSLKRGLEKLRAVHRVTGASQTASRPSGDPAEALRRQPLARPFFEGKPSAADPYEIRKPSHRESAPQGKKSETEKPDHSPPRPRTD